MMWMSSSYLLALQMTGLWTKFSSPLLRALFPGHLSATTSHHSCHHFLLASRSRSWRAREAKSSASPDMASILSCSVLSFSPRSASRALFSSITPLRPSTLRERRYGMLALLDFETLRS